MGKHKKKKPEIRFKGFTDDWEQRKLGDYLEVSAEKNKDNRFTKEDVLSVSGEYGIVNQIEFQGRSFAGASVSNYGVVETGDVVYTKSPLKSNPYGIIKTNKGISGIVSTLYAVYKPKEITDSKFVQIYFELDSRMNSYIHPLVNKGAKNDMKVSAENAIKGMVSFPKKNEQETISLYFDSLDHLITLHQRKLEKLKKVKKSMLEKMFPQNGEMEPQIRFCGFNSTWEQRKFEDLFAMLKNNTLSRAELSEEEGCALNVHYGDVLVQYNEILDVANSNLPMAVSSDITEKYKSSYLQDGDVVIADTAEDESVGKCCEIAGAGDNIILAGLHTMPVRPILKFASKYLGFYLNSPSYHRQLIPLMQGTKVISISKSSIKDTTVLHPNEYEEQNQIGEYFDKLDHLITLHQRKLEKLKKMKKAMLEKMFV